MERAYLPDLGATDSVELTGPEAHHLTRVRRVTPGTSVEVFDGKGGRVRGTVRTVERHRLVVSIDDRLPSRPAPSTDVTLATAVPKGDRFDWVIEKATELGVARIMPLRTIHSVVEPRASKIDRLRRLVIEACKQCGRDRLMEIEDPICWDDLIARKVPGSKLIADPGGGSITSFAPSQQATIAVGPEGGFTRDEIDRAIGAGWRTLGLGPYVLRIETAGIAACAALMAHNPS